MSNIAVTTSQNVNINFVAASIGERIFAFALDMLIKLAYLAAIIYIFTKFIDLRPYLDELDSWSAGAIIFLLTSPIYFYTLVMESLLQGQTAGKILMKIKVIKTDGYQAGFGDYLIRWFFRIIDVFADSGIVGLIAMIVSKNNRRLGDIASGTAVISLKNKVGISHTILEEVKQDYVPAFPQVLALDDNDVRIIKENYQKAQATGDAQIYKKLADKIASLLKINVLPQGFTEKSFVEKILMDYSFYTGKDS